MTATIHARQSYQPRHVAPTGLAPPPGGKSRSRYLGPSTATKRALFFVGLMVGFVVLWHVAGGHLYVMQTPSMCPRVCVGSLILDRPVRLPLRAGQLVTFHPPGSVLETYTHSIARVLPGGYLQTKGLANSYIDPWTVSPSEVVGSVRFTLWGAGWLVKALPLLVVGTLCWALGRNWVSTASRRTWDRASMTALAVVPLWALRPLVRGTVVAVASARGHHHWGSAKVVNTGLLPSTFQVLGGTSAVDVAPGHSAVVSGPVVGHGGVMVHQLTHLPWWGWAALATICLSPLLGYARHLVRGDESPAQTGPTNPAPTITGPRHLMPATKRSRRGPGVRHGLRGAG